MMTLLTVPFLPPLQALMMDEIRNARINLCILVSLLIPWDPLKSLELQGINLHLDNLLRTALTMLPVVTTTSYSKEVLST